MYTGGCGSICTCMYVYRWLWINVYVHMLYTGGCESICTCIYLYRWLWIYVHVFMYTGDDGSMYMYLCLQVDVDLYG